MYIKSFNIFLATRFDSLNLAKIHNYLMKKLNNINQRAMLFLYTSILSPFRKIFNLNAIMQHRID